MRHGRQWPTRDLGGPSWLGGATNWCSYHGAINEDADGDPIGAVACPSNDGNRIPVLRYDTPAIGPASIAVSTGRRRLLGRQAHHRGLHG